MWHPAQVTIGINNTQHKITAIMRVSHFIHYYAECCYAECRNAECHYAECRGAHFQHSFCNSSKPSNVVSLDMS